MKSLQGDSPITPLTEKSILLTDNNNEDQFYPLSQQNNLMHEQQQYNQNHLLNPRILTQKQNLHNKLNQEYQELMQRRNQLRNSYEQQQLQQCSFKPRISQKSVEMKSQDMSQPRYMSPKKIYIQDCTQTLQTQQSPKQKNKKKSNKENLWERLSQNKQSVQLQMSNPIVLEQANQERIDQTKINEIVNRLYNQTCIPKKLKQQNDSNHIQGSLRGSHNEKLVIHYFVREFYKVLTQARCETLDDLKYNQQMTFQFQIENDLCLITINELCQILDNLGFVPLENNQLQFQIFQHLQCPPDFDMILSRNLLCFLLCVQGYHNEIEQIPNYENQYKINFPIQFNNGITQFINGNLRVYNPDLLLQKYNILNVNHLAYKKNRDLHQDVNTSFKTNKQTQVLAIQHRKRVASEIQHQNVTLNDYDQIYNKKKQKLIEEQERINQEQCTFNPQINDAQVKSKYLQSKQQKLNDQVNQSQINIPQFTPNTLKNKPVVVQMKPTTNSNVAIERMIKGRVQRQLSQAIIKQGTCNSKKRQQLEEQIYEQELGHKQPLMFIDVIIDNNKKERIIVNQNDTAAKLASQFIEKNKIDKSHQENLIKLIQQQLPNH
ncbi:unnamed protein product [Paramecium pentaurelia]|uniref:Uncharacterized protein n=1 Tax=Paramecium pentaurelia TaxID=43138 RepID=A0A8S1UKJ2_9CILI|nr:unnamed protein product [Paramecium pentaurelia]